ncbi:MAG: arsenate reductase ArsC [Planctomycetota bacterium]|nr:arsenate reductase ArsC [Planctomycetota bacterium]
MSLAPIRILFLCTGNSARSILAEAIANEMFGKTLLAHSAGSKPKGEPNPLALKTLEQHGLPTDRWRSQSWDEFKDQTFDLVVTLCASAARESCPVFHPGPGPGPGPGTGAGAPISCHWGFPDPPASANPEATFEDVYQGLVEAIGVFARDGETPIDARAAKVTRLVLKNFPNSAIV